MPSSSPARAELAARLTRLREDAGLSGTLLAKVMGVVQSRVWKIENDKLTPAERDIRGWAQACGQPQLTPVLLEELGRVVAEKEFRPALRSAGGAAAVEERVRAAEQQADRIGVFQVAVIPGLLQTARYTRELLSVASGPSAWGATPADVDAKIAIRQQRQEEVLYAGKHVQAVISEAALHVRVTGAAAMAGQLAKLDAMSRVPSVELGIIPFTTRLPAYPLGGFRVYGDDLIVVESISSDREITDPAEVAVYLSAFGALLGAAVKDDQARQLIAAAAAALEGES